MERLFQQGAHLRSRRRREKSFTDMSGSGTQTLAIKLQGIGAHTV